MQSMKKIVYDIADHLPEHASFDDAMYALYVRQKLEEGLRDLEEGRTFTQAEVEERLLGKRTS
jgi:predicted transcriptional regulator